jgi:hypothetical protein
MADLKVTADLKVGTTSVSTCVSRGVSYRGARRAGLQVGPLVASRPLAITPESGDTELFEKLQVFGKLIAGA